MSGNKDKDKRAVDPGNDGLAVESENRSSCI